MIFSRELRDDVLAGEITVSFRLWKRPKVKEGGRYPVGPGAGLIEVDSIELIPFAETRNYVQRVLEAREVYAILLRRERGGSGQSAAAGTAARPQT